MDSPRRAVYIISIASEMLGVHQQTLRIYEHEGLVTPSRRSNQRLYSEEDIELIRRIRYLTVNLGVNLAGVSVLLKLEAAGRFEFDELAVIAAGGEIHSFDEQAEHEVR